MQQTLAQLRAETAPLAGAGDYELLPLVADLERFARTAEMDPAGAAADLHGLLIQSQNFYRIAKTHEQLVQLGRITKTLGLLKKQLGTDGSGNYANSGQNFATPAESSQIGQSAGPRPTNFQIPVQYDVGRLQSTRVADQLQKLQNGIRKPSFQEIARQNAQQLALSQAQMGAGLQSADQTSALGAANSTGLAGFGQNLGGSMNVSTGVSGGAGNVGGAGSAFGTLFSANQAGQVQIPRPGSSAGAPGWATNSAKRQPDQTQDLSLLVENVKLMVNQLSLLQHD